MTLENLINKEMTFLELDNYMVELGYNSELLEYDFDKIVEFGFIYYIHEEDMQPCVKINFDVIYEHSDDEVATATYIRIKQVSPR